MAFERSGHRFDWRGPIVSGLQELSSERPARLDREAPGACPGLCPCSRWPCLWIDQLAISEGLRRLNLLGFFDDECPKHPGRKNACGSVFLHQILLCSFRAHHPLFLIAKQPP